MWRKTDMRARTLVLLAVGVAALGGCLQLETTVRLETDGSATITERLLYSARLLDLASKEPKTLDLASLLTKESALERMKLMGKGIQLVSYKVEDVPGGRQSIAVYKIDDLGELHYVSPFLNQAGYPHRVQFGIGPILVDQYWVGPGMMGVSTKAYGIAQTRPVPRPRGPEDPVPKPPSPAEIQAYRELGPVFKDMLKDFRIRLTFECYAPIQVYGGWRDSGAGVRQTDLIYFSDKQMDKYGYNFLENEELMIDLLRWDLGSPTMTDHLKGWIEDHSLPVLRGSAGIWFRASEPIFRKHLEGKTLRFNPPGRPFFTRPATFAQDGYKEPK